MRLLLELARDAEAKQNTIGHQESAISAIDQEIIDDILTRFSEMKQENSEVQEDSNGHPDGR